MRGSYEINVVYALFLQLQHHVGKLLGVYNFPVPQLAYRIILAENAREIAPGKKDSPRTARSRYRRFFPIVNIIAGNPG
jgi:hypothetical protein